MHGNAESLWTTKRELGRSPKQLLSLPDPEKECATGEPVQKEFCVVNNGVRA
jgi:hypothetical protein